MKIFFGKISTKHYSTQLDEGYYQALQKSCYNGIDVGDYAFVIGGNKIQLWKAQEWGKMPDGQNHKLDFDIIIPDIGIGTKDLIAFKYFKLTIDLIVKSTRSTGAEKKAFFELEYEPSLIEKDLLDLETYKDSSNYRDLRTFLPGKEVDSSSYDVQMQFENGQLILPPIKNCEEEIINRFKDNTKHIGYGEPKKDKTLSVIKEMSNANTSLSTKISIKDLYDACMCKYRIETQNTSYWVVNGFEKDQIEYDLENNSYVMYFQYTVQKIGQVTKHLNKAKKIKPGDKVLLFNENKYYSHSTFEETDIESTRQLTLQDQINNKIKNDPEEIVTYTDARCIYEDLTQENGFNGDWGQRLNIQEWEDIHKEGINIPGIAAHIGAGIITDTIIELKDRNFYDIVKGKLSGEIQNINEYREMKSTINLIKSKKQIILQGPPGTGKTYSAKDFAEHLIYNSISSDKKEQKRKLEESSQFSLVQFHPSYSYEDFVRGISAKSEGGNIVYETENKIFASFSEKAMNNFNAVNKDVKELSREQQIEKLLFQFSEKIQDAIDENESCPITEAVSIQAVEEDAFRYTGAWKKVSQRMKFKDLVLAQVNGVTTRQELKQLQGVSGLAKQHASYYIKVLNNFQEEFKTELKKSTMDDIEKPILNNYILIIDEINRANLPSVLGELIYALEYRNESVESMYAIDGDNSITIPDNLYIIGTMNTADRSVGHIDYAIKRRFAFVDVLPREDVINNDKSKILFNMVADLFVKEKDGKKVNSDFLASDFVYKDVQLGHSYFILKEGSEEEQKSELLMRLNYEIVPILNEYVKDGLLLESAKEKIEKIADFEY